MDTELQQKRITAYRNASELIKQQYGDLALGDILKSISLSQSLSPEKHTDFVNLVGDYILGFYPQDIIETKLASEIGIPDDAVHGIVSMIIKFLTGVAEKPDVPEAPKDLREELELRPETASKDTSPHGEVRPLTRDEVLKSLSPSRTMAGDIASTQQQSEK